jgi:hypothetical protein
MLIEDICGFRPFTDRPQRLYDVWDGWRGDRPMPARRDILPEDLRDLLPYIALMQAMPDPLDCRYIISGEAVDRASERGVKGMTVREVLADGSVSIADQISAMYGAVIKSGTPSFTRGSMDYRDRGFITFDRVLLPLSADAQAVDHLLCGFFYNFD